MNRQEYFEILEGVLDANPRGLRLSELGSILPRNRFRGIPRIRNIPQQDDRFVIQDGVIRLRRFMGENNNQQRRKNVEQIAMGFYTYLQGLNINGGIHENVARTHFENWRANSNIEGNFNFVIEFMRARRMVRLSNTRRLIFAFVDPVARTFVQVQEEDIGSLIVGQVRFRNDEPTHATSTTIGNDVFGTLIIENRSRITQHLSRLQFIHHARQFSVQNMLAEGINVLPNQRFELNIRYTATDVGVHSSVLVLRFQNEICFGRQLKVTNTNGAIANGINLHDELRPRGPYNPPQRPRRRNGEVETAGDLPSSGGMKFRETLLPFKIPDEFRARVGNGIIENDLRRMRAQLEYLLPNPELSLTKFIQLMDILLYVEEIAQEDEMLKYSVENTTMAFSNGGAMLRLTVPGLMEGRPSLLKGDAVQVNFTADAGQERPRLHEGRIWEVERDTVMLRFSPAFLRMYDPPRPVDVTFHSSRTIWKIMHMGLLHIRHQHPAIVSAQLLFPNSRNPVPEIIPSEIIPIDDRLNHEQRIAVNRIISFAFHSNADLPPQPFIIFGPPGTGKTSTIVEAVLQLLRQNNRNPSRKQRILLTAPSNAAANELLARLVDHVAEGRLMRLMSYSRSINELNERFWPYANIDLTSRSFVLPPLETLTKYEVIIATCAMAAKLWYYRPPNALRFSHIIIDEAGHAEEPLTISTFLNNLMIREPEEKLGQLILAGDPEQLGPVVFSNLAKTYGLETSTLERLMRECEPYQRQENNPALRATNGYDPRFIVKLVRCYRCHPAIIEVPNELFYDNQLIPLADENDPLLQWNALPRRGFPIIFHGCEGEQQRELRSPSWFNLSEVEIVVDYIKRLLGENLAKTSEIAVISPYRQQVHKLRQALRLLHINTDELLVGSCEQLQGQERRIVIITTVRSFDVDQYLRLDVPNKRDLGFLSHPKRFNVAVTRAQKLLIVVGNARLLRADECWNRLLQHCLDNGAVRGAIPNPGDFDEQLIAEIEQENEVGEDDDQLPNHNVENNVDNNNNRRNVRNMCIIA